jgi:hypothetical protein
MNVGIRPQCGRSGTFPEEVQVRQICHMRPPTRRRCQGEFDDRLMLVCQGSQPKQERPLFDHPIGARAERPGLRALREFGSNETPQIYQVLASAADRPMSRACTHKSIRDEFDTCPLSGVLQTQTHIASGPKVPIPDVAMLFDDQINARQERWRKGQSDCFCGVQIDGQFECCGLFHRQICGLNTS